MATGLGFRDGLKPHVHYPPIMENEMEMKMENEMETLDPLKGVYRDI